MITEAQMTTEKSKAFLGTATEVSTARTEAPTLTAGRVLDAFVAEKVMGEACPAYTFGDAAIDAQLAGSPKISVGGQWTELCDYSTGDNPTWTPKPYSTDIAAAWEVVQKLVTQGMEYELGYQKSGGMHYAMFVVGRLGDWPLADAESAPLAICLAGLKAVGA